MVTFATSDIWDRKLVRQRLEPEEGGEGSLSEPLEVSWIWLVLGLDSRESEPEDLHSGSAG